jgi:hypothetical protein
MCGLIIIDASNTSCGIFADTCKLLGIWLQPASRGNHKAVSVVQFVCYLNKAVTIASLDCITRLVWVESTMFATYALNCSPINGTKVVCSIFAVSCEIKFPSNIALNAAGNPPVAPFSDSSAAILNYIG